MSIIDDIEALIQPWVTSPEEARALAIAISQQLPQAANESTGVRDGNHALLVGRILGTLIKGDLNESLLPLEPHPVMYGLDYTNRIMVTQPSGHYLITVERVEVEQR